MTQIIELTLQDIYNFTECPVKYLMNKKGDVTYVSPKKENEILFDGLKRSYYLEKMDGKNPTVESLKETMGRLIYSLPNYDLLDAKGVDRRRQLEAIKLAETFAKHETQLEQEIIGVSYPFALRLTNGLIVKDEIPLIRRREGQIEIVVFKTTRNKVSSFFLDTDIGMTLYDMAFREEFDRKPDRIVHYHIPSSTIHYTEREPWQYERMIKKIEFIERSIRNNDYHTNESFMCDSCNARFSCLDYYR